MSESYTLHQGDCLERLKTMPDSSVDSIVTDPPYGLKFMAKKWDYDVPSVEVWAECLRVLKPGGHLLAFGGSRTYHRLAVAVEDAGFEIRDQIMWVYGSGFPKSQNVSKAIDKAAGANREVVSEGKAVKRMIPGADQDKTGSWIKDNGREFVPQVTLPATEAAKQWDGWGTALKPAHEPIVMARKPFKGTVANNVLEHGTGALNIDECRVPTTDSLGGGGEKAESSARFTSEGWKRPWMDDPAALEAQAARVRANVERAESLGRWPANLIHDGSDEVVELFPANAGASAPVKGTESSKASVGNVTGERDRVPGAFHADKGSAARFFYCAKASRKDRHEGLSDPGHQFKHGETLRRIENTATKGNNHPTVKPTDLMAYLCRLVTPANGVVLDPFMGSGSTGKAAVREGFDFIGIELDADYLAIAEARIKHEHQKKREAA